MSRLLSDVPPSLSPVQQRFVDELGSALDAHTFERLAPGHASLERGDGLEVTVRHPDDDACDIRAFVREDWITVFLGDAHEDFKPSDGNEDRYEDGRDFVEAAVAWLVDALRGRIEFTATYRGTDLVSTGYVRHADDGTQHGASSFLTPAHLRIWEPTRRVRGRPSWSQPD